eukprot:4889636-Pleurochrysis_carterae.AAC.1
MRRRSSEREKTEGGGQWRACVQVAAVFVLRLLDLACVFVRVRVRVRARARARVRACAGMRVRVRAQACTRSIDVSAGANIFSR